MLKKLTSALLLGAVLVFGANVALAQPVGFSLETNNGNDTVYVGQASNIQFHVNANGAQIQGLVFAALFFYTGGNWIGPMSDDADGNPLNNVAPSATANTTFASKAWNPNYGQGTDPDTVLYGFTSFGGPWTTSGEVWRVSFVPTGPGTMTVDPVIPPDPPLPPANEWSALDPLGASLPFTLDLPVVTSIVQPNIPPNCTGATGPGTVVFGDLASGTLSGNDPDGIPAPVSFVLISAVNSNATGPNNAITVVGNTWNHQTSNANTDDVGTWTLTFKAFDGLDSSSSNCVVVYNVIAEEPLICFEFGCVEAFSGSDICVPLTANDYFNPCIQLGGFDILFKYDASLLTFKGIDLTGSILETQDWEYLTYRVVSSNPALIRIVAIADMNNSNAHPSGWCLDGLLANICFRTTNDRNLACQSAWLMFYWEDCGDNTASSRDGNHLYIVADPAGGTYVGGNPGAVPPVPGGGILMACADSAAYAQIFSGNGGVTGPADHPCPNALPNKPDPEQLLCFVNGKIKIVCPGDIDDRGDINLNGLAYEIADAVLYSNYFIQGPQVFAPGVPGEAQVAASDINADGSPLTVADLVYLIRVITGDAQPIAGDLIGGGPKVIAGKVNVEVLAQGSHTTVRSTSDVDMGAGLFVFNYTGEISKVEVVGRASQMDVTHQASNGELRVLVYNIEDGHKVAAGHGEILSITTTGAGKVELVNVEAASFMGGALEANVTAKVLPTQFALQQNFPNPFNPSTSLAIDFPTASDYKLTIYNIAGQTVRAFSGNTEAGTITLTWDGRDARGSQVATGVYFYSVEAGAFKDVKKMVLLR